MPRHSGSINNFSSTTTTKTTTTTETEATTTTTPVATTSTSKRTTSKTAITATGISTGLRPPTSPVLYKIKIIITLFYNENGDEDNCVLGNTDPTVL